MASITLSDLPVRPDLSDEELDQLFGAGKRRKPVYNPPAEMLELRQMMAANILASLSSAGVLSVEGTEGADTIVIRGTGSDLQVDGVKIQTAAGPQTNVAATGVQSIEVRALGGDDYIQVLDSLFGGPVQVDGGAGTNTILLPKAQATSASAQSGLGLTSGAMSLGEAISKSVLGTGKIVAYDATTSGTLSLGYLTNGYYADVNLPAGIKLDTGTFQNWVQSGAEQLTGASVSSPTLPSVNPVQMLIFSATGGQIQAKVESDYYQIRDGLRSQFDTPVYYASERLTEWLSLEAQASAAATTFFNEGQWLGELKRQLTLEWGRFSSWLKVHNLSIEGVLADVLKDPRTTTMAGAVVGGTAVGGLIGGPNGTVIGGPLVAAEMARWMAEPIEPRGLAMSDGKWAEKNRFLVQDPCGLFTDEYMRGLIGQHPQGEGTAELRSAMRELFSNASSASDDLLARLATSRGRSFTEFKAEYQKFLEVRANAAKADEIDNVWSEHEEFIGSADQLRFGTVVGAAFGIDAVFGAALSPTGGMAGPDNLAWDSGGRVLSYHGAVHDAAGYLYNHQKVGPGYDYLGVEDWPTDFPLTGQRSGIAYWTQVFSDYPLRVMLNPGGPVNYEYTHYSTPLFGGNKLGSWDISHASFGLTYTGRTTVPGIQNPYANVFQRGGFNLETLTLPEVIAAKATSGTLGAFAVQQALFKSGVEKAFEAIGHKEWANVIDWRQLMADGIASGVDGAVFGSLARTFGITNADITALLPTDGSKAPAVVNLLGTSIEGRVQDFLEKMSLGNAGKATITRLEFDISTYELNIEFDLRHRHEWGSLADLAKGLINDAKLGITELPGLLKAAGANFGEMVTLLWEKAGQNLSTMAVALKGAGADFGDIVTNLWDKASDLSAMAKALKAAGAEFGDIVTQLWDKASDLPAMAKALKAAGAGFGDIVTQLWGKSNSNLGEMAKALKAAGAGFGDIVTQLWGKSNSNLGEMAKALKAAGAGFGDVMTQLWSKSTDLPAIAGALKTAGAGFGEIMTQLWTKSTDMSTVAKALKAAGAGFGDILTQLWTKSTDLSSVAKALKAAGAGFGEIVTQLWSKSSDLSAVAKALKAAGAGFGDVVSQLWGKASGLGAMAKALKAAGASESEIARLLRIDLGASFVNIAKALRNDLAASLSTVASTMDTLGANMSEIATALGADLTVSLANLSRTWTSAGKYVSTEYKNGVATLERTWVNGRQTLERSWSNGKQTLNKVWDSAGNLLNKDTWDSAGKHIYTEYKNGYATLERTWTNGRQTLERAWSNGKQTVNKVWNAAGKLISYDTWNSAGKWLGNSVSSAGSSIAKVFGW